MCSWTLGQSESHDSVRMTLQVELDEVKVKILAANLGKLPNVLRIEDVSSFPCVFRELAVIKVAATPEERISVMEIAKVFRAQVVDVCSGSITFEATGSPAKIGALVEIISAHGIIDLARTGSVAMRRRLRSTGCVHEPRTWKDEGGDAEASSIGALTEIDEMDA